MGSDASAETLLQLGIEEAGTERGGRSQELPAADDNGTTFSCSSSPSSCPSSFGGGWGGWEEGERVKETKVVVR